MGHEVIEEREMNTIEHEGQTYEVLTLDRISEITHAKLAGGRVVGTKQIDDTAIRCESPFGKHLAHTDFLFEELEVFGIQPLRLVPREPVTFDAKFALVNGFWTRVTCLDDGIAYKGYEQTRFRCVEIVEEAK
jgi:hypothetical protein